MAEPTRELAMFPLGSVLFPGMPLPLRVFEPRYLAMLASVLDGERDDFGVVLIERGWEVGGGDARFDVGTVARVVSIGVEDDVVVVLATGAARFEVVRWLGDDPFPHAEVRDLDPLPVDPAAVAELDAAEALVRSTLRRASELAAPTWPPDVVLAPEPATRLWQVAAIAPVGPLDQLALLRSRTADELLARLVEETQAAQVRLLAGWVDDAPDDDDLLG